MAVTKLFYIGAELASAPPFTKRFFVDTTGKRCYLSLGTAAATDWAEIKLSVLPQLDKSVDYTLTEADKWVNHPTSDANARTFTIPANASVPFPIGTEIVFSNLTTEVVSIAITSDTLYLENSSTTGTRSLAKNSIARALKVASTVWIISGLGVS